MNNLMRLAENGEFGLVKERFRDRTAAEVLDVADRLRLNNAYQVAIELYQWLLDRHASPDVHFGLGQCHGKIAGYDAALAHLDTAFRADPGRDTGAGYYAYILERHDRMPEAEKWYLRALDGPEGDDLWTRSHYAWFLEKCDRTEDARTAYEDVLARDPAHTWSAKRYALLLRALGDDKGARTLLLRTMERARGDGTAALNYLEFLLLSEHVEYDSFRATLDLDGGPASDAVVVHLFDYYRAHLLPRRPDPAVLARLEAAAAALTGTVHRDFDSLTELLAERNGDVRTWHLLLRRLTK